MNERVVSKMTNFCVAYMDVGEAREQDAVSFVKLSNSPAITYVSRLELDGPALRHFESQPDSPRINQRFLIS